MNRLGVNIELILISAEKVHYPTYDFLTIHKTNRVSNEDTLGQIKRVCEIRKILGGIIDSLDSDDILYQRYSSFLLYRPCQYFKRFRSCKIATEHQTKELDETRLYDSSILYWSERFFGKLLRKQSDAIIGVTDEITAYQLKRSGDDSIPHLTIGNGFAVQSVPVRQVPPCAGHLHLLCVANVSRWHGLDRLLRGLATYNETPKVTLHIAGDGAELPHLQKLAGDLGITGRVIFHGFTTGEALDALFDQCHIAVGSLGIHRKGLTQTSELKGREYCARGIPYIIACSDPDFPPDFPYILHLPADESPINIEQILAFAREVYTDPDHPAKMRRYAEEHLDWSVKMKKLKNFLEALVGEGGTPEPGTDPLTAEGPKVPGGTGVTGAGDTPSGSPEGRGS